MDLHGILIVDKPRGPTSHDVVARVRRLLRTRKVGHAGTLDPAAEGVIVVAVGRATKLLSSLTSSTKRYAGHVVLGIGSRTGDIEGPVEPVTDTFTPPSTEDLSKALRKFVGEIEQIPPAHSAIKVAGQPLYRRARHGETVEVPSRTVTIHSLEMLEYRYPDLFLDIECSAGTYIRSLARDIGAAMGTGAYLHYLLRTRSGTFRIDDAWTLDELMRDLAPDSFARYALHPALATTSSTVISLGFDEARAWYDGRPVPSNLRDPAAGMVHAFRDDGSWIGAGTHDTERNIYQPRIVVHA